MARRAPWKAKSTSRFRDAVVDARPREALRLAQREEAPLELASREDGPGRVGLQRSRELAGVSVAGVGSREGLERGVVGQLLDLGLVEDAVQAARLERG